MKHLFGAVFILVLSQSVMAMSHAEKVDAIKPESVVEAGDSQSFARTSAKTTHGEIKKMDKDMGKVTLKHGPLTHLAMPAMTMIFKVKDPAQLSELNIGDEVYFVAEQVAGTLVVTEIKKAKQ